MRSRHGRVVAMLAMVTLLAACKGWDYRPDPNFCSLRAAVAQEICAQRERCLGASSDVHDACVTAEARAFEDRVLVDWRRGVRHARMRYHSGRVGACQEAMAASDCSLDLSRTLPMECTRLVTGRQTLDQNCAGDLECGHERICGPSQTCEDLVVPACTLLCIEARRCRGGALEACTTAAVGDACVPTSAPCGGLLVCDWDASSLSGTCRQATDVARVGEGEVCWLDLSRSVCEVGLSCADLDYSADVLIGTCQPLLCGDAGPCDPGSQCGWADGGLGCVPSPPAPPSSLAADGGSCETGVNCASGVCGREMGWIFSSRVCIPSRCE